MKKYVLLLSVAIAFMTGVAATIATTVSLAHGGDLSLIHACVRNNTGAIRIVGATQNCNGNETPLDWPKTQGSGGGVLLSNLVGANLRHAVMVGWDLSNKDFTGADLSRAILGSSDLTGATFTGVNFTAANLFNLNFAGFNLQNTQFGAGVFVDNVDFTGADLTNATLGAPSGAGFQSSNFSGANLTNTILSGEFADVDFTNAIFNGAEFIPVPDTSAALFTNSNFTGADLTVANVSAATWDNTICPDGTNSDSNGNTCMGHLTP
jgi:uncharacterized protein YjbI with pentapeptide repeats